MRPGVITVSDDASLGHVERAMVRHHGVHAILLVGRTTGKPVGWVATHGMLQWLNHDLRQLVPASQGVTEPPTYIEPGATAQEAVKALQDPAVTHLLVTRSPGETPQGVVGDVDVISLCTSARGSSGGSAAPAQRLPRRRGNRRGRPSRGTPRGRRGHA